LYSLFVGEFLFSVQMNTCIRISYKHAFDFVMKRLFIIVINIIIIHLDTSPACLYESNPLHIHRLIVLKLKLTVFPGVSFFPFFSTLINPHFCKRRSLSSTVTDMQLRIVGRNGKVLIHKLIFLFFYKPSIILIFATNYIYPITRCF
jgi:hypothetical protein